MGIEQILMPILGGVAKGVGTSLEEKRQERMQMEAQRNANMARTFQQKPELYEVPEFRNWANKYYGKEEARTQYSIARIQKIQNDYLMEERARTGIMNPEPLSPDQIPPEPQFADFSGEGNPGGVAGFISKFLPGAGAVMNTLGLGGPAAAQAQTIPQPSSTGPASGPQGYAPAGGWQSSQIPVPTGASPAGTIVPAQVGMDERIGVGAVSRIPVSSVVATPGGGATLVIQGTPPPPGTKSAFTRRRPMKPAPGVTASYNKDGDLTVKIAHVDDNLSTNMNEVSRRLIDARRPEGQKLDMTNADDIAEVLDYANELSMKVLASKNALTEEQKLRALESPRNLKAQGVLARTKAEGGREGIFRVESRPDVRLFERNKKREEQIDLEEGKLLGQTTQVTLADGTKTTVSDQEAKQHKLNAAAALKGGGMTEGGAKMVQTSEALVDALGELARLYKPEYVGKIYGRNWYRDLQDVIGTMTGEQAQFWQAYAMARNLRAQQLMGASISISDAERIADEMFDPTNSSTAFAAKVQGFDRAAKNTMVRNRELLGLPREESLAPRPNTPSPAATRTAPTPVQVPSESVRTPPINKDKKSKSYGKPLKTDPNVPLNDPNATSAPPVTYQIRQSDIDPATGKLTPEAQAVFRQMIQNGEIDPKNVNIETLSNEEFDRRMKAREQK